MNAGFTIRLNTVIIMLISIISIFLAPCKSKPCKNNGLCIPTDDSRGFKCQCQLRPTLMKVRKENCAENVALHKQASQSSTHKTYVATNAVSGKNSPGASTKQGHNVHWWQVDLGSLKMIREIDVRVRFRPNGGVFKVMAGNTSDISQFRKCHNIENKKKLDLVKQLSFKCHGGNVVARLVRVEFANIYALAIQEMTIFGWDA